MVDSFELQDEIQALQELDTYSIPNERDLNQEDPERLLEAAVEAVAESSDAITEPDVFDVYRSLLKQSDAVPGFIMSKLLDSISSGLQFELDATLREIEQGDQQGYMSHKTPLEMYVFLLQWFVIAAEKVKVPEEGEVGSVAPASKSKRGRGRGRGGASRSAGRSAAARRNDRVLRLQTQRIWTTTAEREAFVGCLTRPAYHITENEQYMKSQDIKLGIYKIICLAVKHHGHSMSVQIAVMQSLQFYEHLSEPMAECLTYLAKEFDHAQLGDEILLLRIPKASCFAKFLVKFAELAPRSILKQLSLLLGQLDSDSYPMRIAIVEVIGYLIVELANSAGGDAVDIKQTQKQVKGLYDLLLERIMDISSYVRMKVLAVLSRLCEMKSKFPKQRLAVTRAAVAALEDKAASVRKNAAALLVKLLTSHPYGLMHGGMLELDTWEGEYIAVRDELAKVEGIVGNSVQQDAEGEGGDGDDEDQMDVDGGDTDPNEDDDEEDSDEEEDDEDDEEGEDDAQPMDEDEEHPEPARKKKKARPSKLKPRKSQLDVTAVNNEQAALAALEGNQILHLRLRKKYYAEALNFIRQIEGAMDIMAQLLGSTNKPEVLEAMEFFRVAYEYKFASAMLKGIRSRLLECYRNLYFEALPDIQDAKAQVNRIAKNMVERTYDATLAELTSLEEMLRIMMEDGQIHQDVIAKLWQVYSADRLLPKAQRRGAIIILGMLALAKRSVLTDRVDTMLRIGLGPLGKADLTLARYTCVALQRLNGSAKKIKGSLLDKTLRIEMDSPIFHKLQDAVLHPCRSRDWFGLAEQAINTVYALGEHPDVLCDDLIKKLTIRTFSREPAPKPNPQSEADPDAMDEDNPEANGSDDAISRGPTQEEDKGKDKDLGDAFELSQLLFVVGHVAIKHIVFLELVEREWKRQKDEKQTDGEELDQVAGNAEDEIGERIAGVRETELLYGPESLLAIYGPMIVHVCGSPHKFKNRTLRAAATLSFSKFLCVSSQFCDQHHRLLFKILETSKDANIRGNIVIALGDVAVSFSNIIDENSNELYKGLSDNDLVVKKNTLMVLTHLILNGMIKVKGQLGEMAKCLEDPEPRISDLAKLFFTELSTKENAIYNNLPDVISHLSTGDHAVDEETFQSTLKYIFTFIEKEKQAENVVEKLCQRFRLSEEPRQWRDIAFCLSLLPFKSDRSVKKLIEGLQFYRDKLHEPVVFERFTEILAKARQNKSKDKPDSELNEFEQILEEHKKQGEEDQALEKRVEGKKAAAKKRATTRKRRSSVVGPTPPS
ncbi:non-SMC mitotic condensation complex subunit 1-domain-containing protein [Infundibulicybe gibba]|nr:non-SMC mitotic condensation complex subunit 1-domain-containing protein [Infundibulicybe gibba]